VGVGLENAEVQCLDATDEQSREEEYLVIGKFTRNPESPQTIRKLLYVQQKSSSM
jgi:hypothetical protein